MPIYDLTTLGTRCSWPSTIGVSYTDNCRWILNRESWGRVIHFVVGGHPHSSFEMAPAIPMIDTIAAAADSQWMRRRQ